MRTALMSRPAPAVSQETQAYWDAAAKGKLMVRKCTSCGQLHHYPRTICPFCFSDKTEWIEASGKGTIYSYSVMRRAPVPYAMAYVTLAEGPRMVTNIVVGVLGLVPVPAAEDAVGQGIDGVPRVHDVLSQPGRHDDRPTGHEREEARRRPAPGSW